MAPAASQVIDNINLCLPDPSAATVYPTCTCRGGVCENSGALTLICTDVAEIPKNVTSAVGCL